MNITSLCRGTFHASASGASATGPDMIGTREARRREARVLPRSAIDDVPTGKVLNTTHNKLNAHDYDLTCLLSLRRRMIRSL